MEESAPKRRKTSPTTQLSLGGSDASNSSSGVPRRSTRRRPGSSVSPSQTVSASANPTSTDHHDEELAATSKARPSKAGSDDDDERLTSQLEGASENRPASDPIEPHAGNGPEISEPESPLRHAIGGMSAKPRRSMNKPSPRPLPPPSTQEEELLDPFKGRVLRRSPPRGVLPVQEVTEPDLPPTPTQKGISDPAAASTSPTGIHNTPSKRPRRSRALAEKLRSGSSPLKQPPLRPTDLAGLETTSQKPGLTSRATSKGTRTTSNRTDPTSRDQNERLTNENDDENHLNNQHPNSATGQLHPARGIKAADASTEKNALRESLLAEVKKLAADLDILRNESSVLHNDGKRPARTASSKAGLLDCLGRHGLPPVKDLIPDPAQRWLSAALDPMSFLPFGKAEDPMDLLQISVAAVEPPPPISHHPIPMTADEELACLQLFTPLSFTSRVTIPPQPANEDDAPLIQKHAISVSSEPRGIFTARIEMLVNTESLSISGLSVPKLDQASVAELQPFVKKILDQTGPINALKRNISVLTWAMAEWTRLASKRARFWCQVVRELGTREGVQRCVQKMRRSKRRGGPGRQPIESDDEAEADDEKEKSQRFTKAELVPYLGRTSLDLDLDTRSEGGSGVSLRVEWMIGFDWTGEGRSTIATLVQAPGKWHSNDEKGSLTDIPKLFDRLVRDDRTPMNALKTVVALLAGERST